MIKEDNGATLLSLEVLLQHIVDQRRRGGDAGGHYHIFLMSSFKASLRPGSISAPNRCSNELLTAMSIYGECILFLTVFETIQKKSRPLKS